MNSKLLQSMNLYDHQYKLRDEIEHVADKIDTGFCYDLTSYLEKLEYLWNKFYDNHQRILQYSELKDNDYFVHETYEHVAEKANQTRDRFITLLNKNGWWPQISSSQKLLTLASQRQHELIAQIDDIAKDVKNTENGDLKSKLERLIHLCKEFHHKHETLLKYPGCREHDYFAQGKYDKDMRKVKYTKKRIICLIRNKSEDIKDTDSQKPDAVPTPKIEQTAEPNNSCKQTQALKSDFFFAIENLEKHLSHVDSTNIKSSLEEMLLCWEKELSNIHWLYVKLLFQYLVSEEELTEPFKNIETHYKTAKEKALQKLKVLSTERRALKLNKYKIPHFEGNIEEWPAFCQMYTKLIHEDNTLSNIEKMSQLKALVKNEAFKVIEHLAVSEENYDAAWNILNERFYNERLMFQLFMDKILDHPNININNAFNIKSLLDITSICVQGLEAIGYNIRDADPIIAYVLTQKLDKEGLLLYKQYTKNLPETQVLDVLEFLEQQYQTVEAASGNCKDD